MFTCVFDCATKKKGKPEEKKKVEEEQVIVSPEDFKYIDEKKINEEKQAANDKILSDLIDQILVELAYQIRVLILRLLEKMKDEELKKAIKTIKNQITVSTQGASVADRENIYNTLEEQMRQQQRAIFEAIIKQTGESFKRIAKGPEALKKRAFDIVVSALDQARVEGEMARIMADVFAMLREPEAGDGPVKAESSEQPKAQTVVG